MFRLMRRQFTDHEWEAIRWPEDEWDQLAAFYRHWVRMEKEIYVDCIDI